MTHHTNQIKLIEISVTFTQNSTDEYQNVDRIARHCTSLFGTPSYIKVPAHALAAFVYVVFKYVWMSNVHIRELVLMY